MCVAAVSQLIIGDDFLSHFNLIVDLDNKKLLDSKTVRFLQERPSSFSPFSFTMRCSVSTPHEQRFQEYPSLTTALDWTQPVTHTMEPHILTHGQPAHASPRRLAPEKLEIARQEFEHMIEFGIGRLPFNFWSSALFMIH